MSEINGVTHVPQMVFRLSTEEGDEARHVALREGGQVLCGVEPSPERPTPGGEVCGACETALEHVSVVMGDYPRDTVAEEVPAP